MKHLSFAILLFLIMLRLNAQYIVHMRDGSIIKAKIVEITPDSLKYLLYEKLDEPINSIHLLEIYIVIYEDGTTIVFK